MKASIIRRLEKKVKKARAKYQEVMQREFPDKSEIAEARTESIKAISDLEEAKKRYKGE
jgi:hypothetical protein